MPSKKMGRPSAGRPMSQVLLGSSRSTRNGLAAGVPPRSSGVDAIVSVAVAGRLQRTKTAKFDHPGAAIGHFCGLGLGSFDVLGLMAGFVILQHGMVSLSGTSRTASAPEPLTPGRRAVASVLARHRPIRARGGAVP